MKYRWSFKQNITPLSFKGDFPCLTILLSKCFTFIKCIRALRNWMWPVWSPSMCGLMPRRGQSSTHPLPCPWRWSWIPSLMWAWPRRPIWTFYCSWVEAQPGEHDQQVLELFGHCGRQSHWGQPLCSAGAGGHPDYCGHHSCSVPACGR